jgi:hypothetical protein
LLFVTPGFHSGKCAAFHAVKKAGGVDIEAVSNGSQIFHGKALTCYRPYDFLAPSGWRPISCFRVLQGLWFVIRLYNISLFLASVKAVFL